jgi:antitoxin Phd
MSSQTSHLRNRWAMTKSLKNLSRTTTITTPPSRRNAAGDSWQLQTAKAKFSEVFRRARNEGPQRITRQGKEGVVMVAEEQYDRLVGKSHQPKSLVQFFRASPLVGVELDLERERDSGRDIEL